MVSSLKMDIDESSGMGFWQSLSDYQLLIVINTPQAFSPSERGFAAQEYSNRTTHELPKSSQHDDSMD